MAINQYLDKIKAATRGEEVRGSIHDAIEQCYADATGNPESIAGAIKKVANIEKNVNEKTAAIEEDLEERFEALGEEVESAIASKANRLEMFPYYPDFDSYDFSKTDPVLRKVENINVQFGTDMFIKEATYTAPFDGFAFFEFETTYANIAERGFLDINGCKVWSECGFVEEEPSRDNEMYAFLKSPLYPVKKGDEIRVEAYVYTNKFVATSLRRVMNTYFMKPRYVGKDEQTITTKVNSLEAASSTMKTDIANLKKNIADLASEDTKIKEDLYSLKDELATLEEKVDSLPEGGGNTVSGAGWSDDMIDLLDGVFSNLKYTDDHTGQNFADELIALLRKKASEIPLNPNPPSSNPVSVAYSGTSATISNLKNITVTYSGTSAMIGE